jgi:PAN domain
MPRMFRIVIALAALGSSAAEAQTLTTESNVDYYGGDYTSFVPKKPSAQLCSDACAKDKRCVAYTFARPSSGSLKGRCYLKAKIGKRRADKCCTSGRRISNDNGRAGHQPGLGIKPQIIRPTRRGTSAPDNGRAPSVEVPSLPGGRLTFSSETNVDYHGGDYDSFVPRRPDANECRRRCVAKSRCVAYTFLRPNRTHAGGRCYLKNRLGERRLDRCCESGKKVIVGLPTPNNLVARETCVKQTPVRVARFLRSETSSPGSRVRAMVLHNDPYSGIDQDSYVSFNGRRIPITIAPLTSGIAGRKWYFNNVRSHGGGIDVPVPGARSLDQGSYIRLGNDHLPCDANDVAEFRYGGFVVGWHVNVGDEARKEFKGYTARGNDNLVRDLDLIRTTGRTNSRTSAELRYGIAIEVDTRNDIFRIYRTSSCFKGHLAGPPVWRPELRRKIIDELKTHASKLTEMWDLHARTRFTILREWLEIPGNVDLKSFRWSRSDQTEFEICYRSRTGTGRAAGSPPSQSQDDTAPETGSEARRPPETGTEMRRQ